MLKVIGMSREELIALATNKVIGLLSEEDVVYIAKTLDAYWQYDYEAAKQGRPGLHAELKSLRHSDGFFVSKILLQYQNIREIMAEQLVFHFNRLGIAKPVWVAGIPDGATELGRDVARIMGVKYAEMKKEDGHIVMVSLIAPGDSLLWIEDFCTQGTGLKEATLNVLLQQPHVNFCPYELVIINRGGLKEIAVEGIGDPFQVVAAADHRVDDWEPPKCPLCNDYGSGAIKPKATEENWQVIITSQQ